MSLARVIRSAMIRRYADPARLAQCRQRAELARQRAGRAHQVLYFHQVDDPYSQLAVQALKPLLARYDIQLLPKIVAQPTPIAIHEQQLWDAWAERDAEAIAPHYGLRHDGAKLPADAALLGLARRLALAAAARPDFADCAIAIGSALRRGAGDELALLAGTLQPVSAEQAAQQLQANFALRHRLRHYLGGMFYYEGEWYWGIDRLHYLETRLDALGARRAEAPAGPSLRLQAIAPPTPAVTTRRLQLEFYPSLRSPYTHLAYPRIAALCQRYPIDLILRPVIPMMMRGVKADQRKGVYIIQDTAREAARLGLAFGNVWDPFGKPILRAYSLFPWARDQGRGFEYLHAYSQAVWGERVNAWSLDGLRRIVERAGLSWQGAQRHLDRRDWEDEIEANVQAMISAGSWGVPTLRLLPGAGETAFTVWGQDRLWLIEAQIQHRLGMSAASTSAVTTAMPGTRV